MKLKTIKLSDIKPYVNNPRKNDAAVDAVMESIKQCEYVAPIILDENNVILAGHTRYKALKELGYDDAECVIKEGLTEEQKKKYRLLDNKTNELADWDMDLLAEELDGLDFGDLDLDWGIDEDDEQTTERKNVDINESISIIIDCSNEEEAERIFESLTMEGYECRISTL